MKRRSARRQVNRFWSVLGSLRHVFSPEKAGRFQHVDGQALLGDLDILLAKAQVIESRNDVLRCILEGSDLFGRIVGDSGFGLDLRLQSAKTHLEAIPNLYQDLDSEESVREMKHDVLDTICDVRAILMQDQRTGQKVSA